MAQAPACRDASTGHGVLRNERHRPEQTLLYRLVEQHYPEFADAMAAQGKPLPAYVEREFEDYLKCSRPEYGFWRVRCEDCHVERLVAFSAIAPALLYLLHPCSRPASAGAFARAAARGAWPKVRLHWSMTSCPMSRSVNGS